MRRNRTVTSRTPSPILEASEEAELLAELATAPLQDVELLLPGSFWSVWARRLRKLLQLLSSQSILPDSLRDHLYTMPTIVGIVAVLLFLPLRLYFLLLLLGIVIGYIYAIPEALTRPQGRNDASLLQLLLEPLKFSEKPDRTVQPARLSVSPAIDAALDVLFENIIRDLVNPWYVPLCKSGETDFQSCLRSTLNAAVMNLVKFGGSRSKDMVTLIIYGITNALIVHMEEFRTFETSRLPLDRFIASGRSRRVHHKNYSEELEHLRQIAGLLLKKLLPKQESRSILLNSLMKEIIASNALSALIDRISDPDFINEQIIKFLQDPADSQPRVEPGWNLVILKGSPISAALLTPFLVLRGKNLPPSAGSGGLYLIIHIAGRRVKTRKIRDQHQLWNDVFRFKLSDLARENLKVYLQLCQYNYMGQDQSFGYSKLIPDFEHQNMSHPLWLKFAIKPGANQPVNRAAIPPEILVEVTAVSGSLPVRPAKASQDEDRSFFPAEIDYSDMSAARDWETPSPHALTDTLSIGSAFTQAASETLDHGMITLDAALQNNELFMEFLEYLNTVKAPPYLQFMMNVDALRQFAAMSLGIDSKTPNCIDEYFRKGPLSETQLEQLKMIKHDAADVFSTHFSDSARYRIPLDPGMQQELQELVSRSDRVDGQGYYVGRAVGPNIFVPAYRWVANVLEEVYFPKFKSSDTFGRFLDRAHFATLNFTVEDDKTSVYSQDSSAMPSQWAYTDQLPSDRQQAKSVEARSRTSSMENLEEMRLFHDDPQTEIKKIVSEVSISRQKLACIEDQIEAHQKTGEESDSPVISALRRESKAIQTQVANLMGLLEEHSRADQEQGQGNSDSFWLDLRNVSVRVTSVNQNSTPVHDEGVFSSLWTSTMGPVITAVSEPSFDIEISQSSGSPAQEKVVISRTSRKYTDFYKLHRLLKRHFPKVGKIEFPEQSLLNTEGLDRSLQAYLQMLISDEFVRQSSELREFVTIDGDYESEQSAAGQFMEAIVGKKVKDVFRSATSILTRPGANAEERRSRFYETRERHTTADVNSVPRASPIQPTFHSMADLPGGTADSLPELRARQPSAEPLPKMDPTPSHRSLHCVPSVELPPPPVPSEMPPLKATGSTTVIEELTDAEIEMLVETFFAFIIETFDLREPNQWLRRKLLGVFKQLLKQAYGDTLSKVLADNINDAFSEKSILGYLEEAQRALYPEGVFIKNRPPLAIRSEDQKFATMVEARTLFLKRTPDFIQNMAGRYNAVCGMTRILHSLQHKELNKMLIFACLDIVLKLLFSERATTQ